MIKVHVCALRKDCRSAGIIMRVHLYAKNWNWGVALRPADKFAGRIDMAAWRARKEIVWVTKRSSWTTFKRTEGRSGSHA